MIEALPPPYRSSKESIDSPYDANDDGVSTLLPFTTHLPTSPLGEHRYSSRLRRLLQQRSSSRGVYLTLHIPHTLNNCKLISIESASSSSSSSCSSMSSMSSSDDGASIHTADTEYDGISENLIHYTTSSQNNCEKMPLLIEEQPQHPIPFIEDLEAGRRSLTLKHAHGQPRQSALKSANSKKDKKRKRVKFKKDPKYRHRDRHAYGYIGSTYEEDPETSWLTFFLLLLLVFTMVCAAGVFIAWALGFAGAHAAGITGTGVGAAAAGGVTVGGVGGAAGKAASPVHIIPIVHADRPIQGVSVQNKVHGKERRSLEDMLAEIEKRNSRVWRHQIKREPDEPEPVKAKALEKRRSAIKERTAIKEEYLQNTDMMW
ncbi:hypothetical protein AA313_de0207903 [Arthrobotrys entomopaga]|nr:hypothetical protein AA313_de0207903 [Arthrobotrys entomopaga]